MPPLANSVQQQVEPLHVLLQVNAAVLLSRLDRLLRDPGPDSAIPPVTGARERLPEMTRLRSRYQPEGKPQSPGVISSTELPAGSRK
jgi:hypothetical protein